MEISFAAETLGYLGAFPITNSLLMSWITMGILIVVGLAAGYHSALVPGRVQNVVEIIVDTMLDFFAGIMGSRKEAEKVFPIIFTFFIFILLSNWLGILPGVGAIGIEKTAEGASHGAKFIPLLRSSYADLNMTLALAICSLAITHIMGISAIGIKNHVGKFISFKSPMAFFVGILETIAETAKVLSFSFRLFGNIFAGEVLLIVMIALLPYIAPVPFLGMELFVGFIQALVFSMLTLVFIKVAITQPEH